MVNEDAPVPAENPFKIWYNDQAASPRGIPRWPVDPAWIDISRATLRSGAASLKRTYGVKGAASQRRIIVGMRGFISSYAALINEPDIPRLVECLNSVLQEWEIETGNPRRSPRSL